MRDCREKGRGEGNREWRGESREHDVMWKRLKGKQYTEERECCAISLIIDCLCVFVCVCVRACTAAVVCSALLWFLSHPQSHTAASMHDWWSQLTPASPGLSVLSEEPPGLIAKGTLEMNHERNERQPNRREESVLDSDNKENRNKHIA